MAPKPAVNPNPTRAKHVRERVDYKAVVVCEAADDSNAREEETGLVVLAAKKAGAVALRGAEAQVPLQLAPARATGVNSLIVPLTPKLST